MSYIFYQYFEKSSTHTHTHRHAHTGPLVKAGQKSIQQMKKYKLPPTQQHWGAPEVSGLAASLLWRDGGDTSTVGMALRAVPDRDHRLLGEEEPSL
jgi:hypothetical protein